MSARSSTQHDRAAVPWWRAERPRLFLSPRCSDCVFYWNILFVVRRTRNICYNSAIFIGEFTYVVHRGSLRYPVSVFFFFFFFLTGFPNCANDIWQKFPWAGSVARKVLASLYQSIWLMFPCLELPLDGNLLWASLANWNQISSTAWCDIDPYSTPRQPIDRYWFTIKNTPLLVQHPDQYFKAEGGKYLKRKGKNGFCFLLEADWDVGYI